MANAPSTFQRYINWTLREYIDDFCSAYLDDVLIYTDGTRKEHQRNTNKVLEAMGKAGLPLDIKKCEFDVKSVRGRSPDGYSLAGGLRWNLGEPYRSFSNHDGRGILDLPCL